KIPATIVAFQNSVERREIGIASGLATFSLNLGGAIGVSLHGAVQISLFASDLSALLAGSPSGGAAILQEAFAQSISSVFWIVLGVSVATFVAVLLMRRRSEEHTSELQSRGHLVCRLLLEKKDEGDWTVA